MTTIQKLNIKLKIVESFDEGGINQWRAGMKYGTQQPTASQVAPFFLDKDIWRTNYAELKPMSAAITSTGFILLRKPLAEAIQTDGNQSCISQSSNGITSRLMVSDELIASINDKGLKMSDTGFVVFEKAFTVLYRGSHSYLLSIDNPESIRVGYVNAIPTDGLTQTGAHPFLFTNSKSYPVYLQFSKELVAIGFASIGNFNTTYKQCNVYFPVSFRLHA